MIFYVALVAVVYVLMFLTCLVLGPSVGEAFLAAIPATAAVVFPAILIELGV